MEQPEHITLKKIDLLAEENKQILRQEVFQKKVKDSDAGIFSNSYFTTRQILNRLLGDSKSGGSLFVYHATCDYGRESRYKKLTPEEVNGCFADPSSRNTLIQVYEIVRDAVLARELQSIDKISFEHLFTMRFLHKKTYAWLEEMKTVLTPILWTIGKEFPLLPGALKLAKAVNKRIEEKSVFKKPPESWKQITFCILKDLDMEISVRGQTFSQKELLTKKVLPNYLCILLCRIVYHGKPFDSKMLGNDISRKEYVQRLRKKLRDIFEINEDPIPYSGKAKQYVPQFKHDTDCELEGPIF
jgi:hypothetical protein